MMGCDKVKRLAHIWIKLRSSLWFMPSLMVLMAVALAVGMIELDARIEIDVEDTSARFLGASSDGARKVLATIAASVMTVAGVIFSVTIVTLSLSANAYTPRILRNFMRDRGNQFVLGFFVSLFTYCLMVLRTIRGGDDGFIPAVSVALAIVLAIVGIYLLIYFIHHSATTIQPTEILAEISAEAIGAINAMFPEKMGEEFPEVESREDAQFQWDQSDWRVLTSSATGYIQTVHSKGLIEFAEECDSIVRMERAVGDFVVKGAPLGAIISSRDPSPEMVRRFNSNYGIDHFRSIEQDPAFGIRQIVDMAIKALSPGINDSTTAANCVDHLGAILHCLIQRRIPSRFRYQDEKLRVIVRAPDLGTLVNLALNEIRQNADGNVALMLRLLQRIADMAEATAIASRRNLLWKHVQLLREKADATVRSPHDRDVLDRGFLFVAKKLGKQDQWIPLSEMEREERGEEWRD